MASDDSSLSGGLLVVLGIVVALGLVFLFMHYNGGGGVDAPDVNIEVPNPAQ